MAYLFNPDSNFCRGFEEMKDRGKVASFYASSLKLLDAHFVENRIRLSGFGEECAKQIGFVRSIDPASASKENKKAF